jgi:hypothetical protein
MAGRTLQGAGVFLMLVAIGIAAWDLSASDPIWVILINVITFGCGIANFWMGTRVIRQDREERIFTEAHPRRLRERRDAWLNRGK